MCCKTQEKDEWINMAYQTFFADEFLCGCAEIITEFPSILVIHPSQVHTVLVVLPVVWLAVPPWEEVLRSKDKNSQPAAIFHNEALMIFDFQMFVMTYDLFSWCQTEIVLQLYASHSIFTLTAGVPSVYTNWFSTLISFKPTQASPGMWAADKRQEHLVNLCQTIYLHLQHSYHFLMSYFLITGLTRVLSELLTSEETQFFLRVEADQVSLLSVTVSLSILPVFQRLGLKLIAEVPIQQISSVTVGICGKTMTQLLHS